ncbi:nucleobindin-2-like isoform X4 [Anneissia japonica]|nr:nucleobindin-2-like isoform X4 [Anneissia japonica]XP_033099208.1 nucleobindin-2-like isoform X4 [Anneissia japonica]XP_033099209.1 nucleobindin-2-like isoform X4 [Anneissia japonica]
MKLIWLLVLCALSVVDMKPVQPVSSEEKLEDDMDTGLEYDKYLRQVISVLEKDPEMRKKMESSNLEDLKSGKLALELDQMPGHFRSQLDELKRMEVQRLRAVAKQMVEKEAGIPGSNPKESFENLVGHVDPKNPDTFNERDLTNLLRKATSDLDAADKKRREEFKNYEMEKELQRRQKLKEMDEQHRKAAENEYQDQKKKLKEHDKIKHPGSKAQLEEVWEETDHLDKEDFNPRTFFALHDTNGDGNLDPFELEALFIKEVEKIYKDSVADPKEKFEELARMREHVLAEIDLDKNKLVSKEEFLKATDESQFEKDEGWEDLIKDLQQEEMFEEEELEGYEKTLQEKELKRQKQREEFEARKQKMQMEQGTLQKDIKQQQQAVNMEQVVLDQAAAQKKLTEMQQGNDKLKFDPANNAIDQKKQ